jgi:phage terminase small subunit
MTDKQTMFISEYLKDFNATRAAKEAGYSEKTAKEIGSQNLTKPEIRQAIEKYINETLDNDKMTLKREIIDELRIIAFTRGEEVNETAKLKAIELLGKYMSMFQDRTQLSTIDGDGKDKGIDIVIKRAKID